VGQLVLAAEAHRVAPIPVGLINGTAYRGGTQPPLAPFANLAALRRRLLQEPDVPDREVISIVGPAVLGDRLHGPRDIAALLRRCRIAIATSPAPMTIFTASAASEGAVLGLGGLLPVASTVTATTMARDTSHPKTYAAPFLTPRFEGSPSVNAVSGSERYRQADQNKI